MAFAWKDFLDLAAFLEDEASSYTKEAALRSAASSAYYAAFCHARNYARQEHSFLFRHSGQDHEGVRRHFKDRGMPATADTLETLRRLRNACDYDDVVANLAFVARTAVVLAQEVLTSLV